MDHFNPSSVALAVIGYYPSWYEGELRNLADTGKMRGDLALEFVRKAKEIGYHVVVVDGGSSPIFLQHLSTITDKLVIEKMPMKAVKRSPKKQRAYLLASKIPGVKAIVSAEAEKVSLIDQIPELAQPLITDQAEIVIPKREEALFQKSYPYFQYISESEANNEYNTLLIEHGLLSGSDERLDILFGPIAFQNKPEVLTLFLQRVKFRKYEDGKFPSPFHDPDQYSNAYFFPTIMALKKNMRVKSVTIPFMYSEIQKENEEYLQKEFMEKRKLQKEGILSNLHDFLGYIERKPQE